MYFEDLPFGCEVWCSVAAIGFYWVLYVSVSAWLLQEVTMCAIISPCHNFFVTQASIKNFE